MRQFRNLTIKQKGQSLIEMLAAVTMFAITIGAISGLFISGIRSQRRVLATQELLDQTSYVLEYTGRALRMAKKELSSPPACLTVCGRGCNYELTTNGIKFIDYRNVCTEFFLDTVNHQLEKTAEGTTLPLTSSKLQVNSLRINLSGEVQPTADYLQPRVTIFLEIEGRETGIGRPKIQIQTSTSQRDLDVTY